MRAGEIFGLLGPERCGQDHDDPDAARADRADRAARLAVVGLDPTRGPLEVKRRVGYLPDSVGFYGDLTGRENLRYTARLNRHRRATRPRTAIDAVLDQVGLTERADDRSRPTRAACSSASASPTRWSRTRTS